RAAGGPVRSASSHASTMTLHASRHGRGRDALPHCPCTEDEYRAFYAALTTAECAALHAFEHEFFFQGCLPAEVIASGGPETLLFGPMKPVGLLDPRTGKRPFAVAQLPQDALAASRYSMLG